MLPEDVLHRELEPRRVAEIAGGRLAEILGVADRQRPVEAELTRQQIHLLLGRVGTELLARDGAGRELVQREDEERDDEQREQEEDEVLGDEARHRARWLTGRGARGTVVAPGVLEIVLPQALVAAEQD